MAINFVSSKDSDEICTMQTKKIYIYIAMGDETDEIIKELFESLLQSYQEALHEKLYFPSSKVQKYQENINFPSTF